MLKVMGIATTGLCWLLGVLFAWAALYAMFFSDGFGIEDLGGALICNLLAVSFLFGGRAAGRKVRYGWNDLDKEDKAYLRGRNK